VSLTDWKTRGNLKADFGVFEQMNKILIVDDDRSVAEMVRMALEENGYAVVTSPSAEDAKKAIATERPAIASSI
jgi:DNA-binding NtrC family response regulator